MVKFHLLYEEEIGAAGVMCEGDSLRKLLKMSQILFITTFASFLKNKIMEWAYFSQRSLKKFFWLMEMFLELEVTSDQAGPNVINTRLSKINILKLALCTN